MKRRFFAFTLMTLFLIALISVLPVMAADEIGTPKDLELSRYGTGRVMLKWSPVPEVEGYQVYFQIGKGKWGTLDHLTPGTFDIVKGIPNKGTVKVYVTAVKGAQKSGKSEILQMKMTSKSLPAYPNFPVHPDYTYDKDGAINNHGVWVYIYSMDRVGEDFPETYYEKVLKEDHYNYTEEFNKITRNYTGKDDRRYGDYTAEATTYTFTAYGEAYTITKNIVVGTKRSENYFSVQRIK